MSLPLSRRAVAATLLTLVAVPSVVAQQALPPDVEAAIRSLAGTGATRPADIVLQVPETAENGSQVPVTVSVSAPAGGPLHVASLHLVATKNPTPGIASFEFGPALTRAQVATRIRIAEDQTLLALAVWSDGSVSRAAVDVRVSVGGCST